MSLKEIISKTKVIDNIEGICIDAINEETKLGLSNAGLVILRQILSLILTERESK